MMIQIRANTGFDRIVLPYRITKVEFGALKDFEQCRTQKHIERARNVDQGRRDYSDCLLLFGLSTCLART